MYIIVWDKNVYISAGADVGQVVKLAFVWYRTWSSLAGTLPWYIHMYSSPHKSSSQSE